jgi:hypothetical protein
MFMAMPLPIRPSPMKPTRLSVATSDVTPDGETADS